VADSGGQFGATARPPNVWGAPLIQMRPFMVLNEVEKELKNILNNALHFVELLKSRAGLSPSLLSIGINNAILS